jgi:hypothetical protein
MPYFAILPRQTGLERMDYSAVKGVTVPAFLWRVHVQSGFKEGNRRMQCDHRPGIRQPVSDDSAASRQSRRILEAPDSAQLTQTSALTGFRPVPKVRMSSSLRHAVWTAEKFRRPSPQNMRNMPIFRDYSSANRTAENELLGIKLRLLTSGFSPEGTFVVRFPVVD